MRRILIILALSVSLAGCATIQTLLNAGSVATASISNPVTPERLNTVENTLIVAFAALNAYRKTCLEGAGDVNCRTNIKAIQVYTRPIPATLIQLRAFVRNNDQVNAITAYNQIQILITNFKATAAARGMPTGS